MSSAGASPARSIHVLGDVFLDVMASVGPNLPTEWGGVTEASTVTFAPGGSSLNVAIHLASLVREPGHLRDWLKGNAKERTLADAAESGALSSPSNELPWRVRLFSSLGEEDEVRQDDQGEEDDEHIARVIQKRMSPRGMLRDVIEVSGVEFVPLKLARDDSPPELGICICLTGPKDRAFVSNRGASASIDPEQINVRELAACEHLHVGGLYNLQRFLGPSLEALLRAVRRANPSITISLDTNFDGTNQWGHPWFEKALEYVDIVKMNNVEAMATSRQSDESAALAWLGARVRLGAVVTMGERGAMVSQSRGTKVSLVTSPSLSALNLKAVDPTGAGDAFMAGLLAALCEARGADPAALPRATELGCACGSLNVTRMGASCRPVSWRSLIVDGFIV